MGRVNECVYVASDEAEQKIITNEIITNETPPTHVLEMDTASSGYISPISKPTRDYTYDFNAIEELRDELAKIYINRKIDMMLDWMEDIQRGLDEVHAHLLSLRKELSGDPRNSG